MEGADIEIQSVGFYMRNLQNADIKRFGVGGFLLAPFLAGGNT